MISSPPFIDWINRLDAHYRLYICICIALLTGFLTSHSFPLPVMITSTWLAFALSNLLFSWITILTSHPLEVKRIAKIQDSNRTLIFLIVLSAALISLFAVLLLLKSSKETNDLEAGYPIFLSFGSVFCAWWLVHTLFTFRYAHLFYSRLYEDNEHKNFIGGLDFPEEKQPDYLDFTYFSFVIGMTFQVSDVEISSRKIRRLALMHAIVSFIFNTFILALSINIILQIIQK